MNLSAGMVEMLKDPEGQKSPDCGIFFLSKLHKTSSKDVGVYLVINLDLINQPPRTIPFGQLPLILP